MRGLGGVVMLFLVIVAGLALGADLTRPVALADTAHGGVAVPAMPDRSGAAMPALDDPAFPIPRTATPTSPRTATATRTRTATATRRLTRRAWLPLILRKRGGTPTRTPTPRPGTPTRTSTPRPPTRTPTPPAGWQTILYDGFEGAWPGPWIIGDASGANEYLWTKSSCRPSTGSYSAWAIGGGYSGSALSCGSYYPTDLETWMIFGPFSLADANQAYLRFDYWVNVEEDFDRMYVLVSPDGNTFNGVYATGAVAGTALLDFADFPGFGDLRGEGSMWLAFGLVTDESITYPEGAYVDNVRMDKCAGTGCTTAEQPAAHVDDFLPLPGPRTLKDLSAPSGKKMAGKAGE